MTVIGLDALGMLFFIIALGVIIAYILVLGWNFEFTKGQFLFVTLVIMLLGMFFEAWFRETGDEVLIGFALFGLVLYLVLKWLLARRRRRWAASRGR